MENGLDCLRERSRENFGGGRGGGHRRWTRADAAGTDQYSAGAAPGRHCLSGEEQHVLFSFGDFDIGQRRAFGGAVFGWAVPAITFICQGRDFFRPSLSLGLL